MTALRFAKLFLLSIAILFCVLVITMRYANEKVWPLWVERTENYCDELYGTLDCKLITDADAILLGRDMIFGSQTANKGLWVTHDDIPLAAYLSYSELRSQPLDDITRFKEIKVDYRSGWTRSIIESALILLFAPSL